MVRFQTGNLKLGRLPVGSGRGGGRYLKHMTNKHIVDNTKWIIVCKIIQSILQLVMGALCARYLGPHNYGLIGYAGSLVAFAFPFVQLGLQATLVKELVDTPEREGEIMGTSIVMELFSGMACILVVNIAAVFMNAGERITIIVCAISSVSLLFRSFELMQRWFQYKFLSKYPSVISVCVYVIVSAYRAYLLITSKNVYWFALIHTLEYMLMSIALIFVYRKLGAMKLSFSWTAVKQLFKRSKYYVLSAVMVTVFQNTDHIMLKMIVGEVENGYYTAAVTSATVAMFIYAAIVDSMRPEILDNRKNQDSRYEKNIKSLYCIIFYLALAQGIGFTVFSRLIVKILYGTEYMQAAGVVRIIIWQIGFSYMGTIRNIWILAEGKQKLVWKLNLCGVMLNVIINALLIPVAGARGAALASVATQIFTNFVLGFFIEQLKENNRLLLAGIHPRMLCQLVRDFKRNRG